MRVDQGPLGHLMLLIRSKKPCRSQAENPLMLLSEFAKTALSSMRPRGRLWIGGGGVYLRSQTFAGQLSLAHKSDKVRIY